MGNRSGLFFILGGGFGCWGCCGVGGGKGISGIMGVSSLLSDMYLIFSVRACGCLLQGFGQFWLQLWWQKSCSAIFSALISDFVGVL
jgi:hypothetical protein